MGRVCAELRTDSSKLGGEKRNPQPTRWSNRVGWFKTSTGGRQVDWIRDDEKTVEKTQIRRKSHRIRWDFARSSQNLMNVREIAPESRKISPGFRFFHQFLENFSRNLEIFRSVQVFQVLREENWNPTCRNRFLVMKTRRRPAGVVGSANFGSDLVGS